MDLSNLITFFKECKKSKDDGVLPFSLKDVSHKMGQNYVSGSLSRKAKPALFQFPVLTTDIIPLSTLTMINKALERQYASFILIATGLDSIVDTSKAGSTEKYLRTLHQNMNFKNSVNDMLVTTLREDNKPYLGEEFDLENMGLNLSEAGKKPDITREEQQKRQFAHDEYMDEKRAKRTSQSEKNKMLFDMNMKKADMDNQRDMTLYKQKLSDKSALNKHKMDMSKTITDFYLRRGSGVIAQLADNDVKKSNELIPTIVNLSLVFQNLEKGGVPVTQNINIGIKTISHLVPSEEVIHNIYSIIKEKRSFFNFLRWTTGEIRFWKDFVANLDEIKKQAIASRKDSYWWKALKDRAFNKKLSSRSTFSKTNVLPNACIIMAMEEVEYISNTYNINLLKNLKAVRTIIAEFALLSFVIVDESSEIAYFLFDGDDKMQAIGYNALERENKNTNNEIKSIISLLGR